MRDFLKTSAAVTVALLLVIFAVTLMPQPVAHAGQAVGEQALLKMRFINDGVQALGAGVLQAESVSSLSAAVASATRTSVATAPAAGNIYIKGVVIEKSAGGTGVVTISEGTGTNCGTNTAVIVTFTNPVVTTIPLSILTPTALRDVCITTEGASTSARILYQ
jgi:hypothetical protein